jgi:hypothetical protein
MPTCWYRPILYLSPWPGISLPGQVRRGIAQIPVIDMFPTARIAKPGLEDKLAFQHKIEGVSFQRWFCTSKVGD